MSLKLVAVVVVTFVLLGCETFEPQTLFIERRDVFNEDGLLIYADLKEDYWSGARWWQFTAHNTSTQILCTRVTMAPGTSSDYASGTVYKLDPGGVIDVAYAYVPAYLNNTLMQKWDVKANGECGYPPQY